MAMTQAAFSQLVDEAVSAVMFERYGSVPSLIPVFFDVRDSDRYREKSGEIGSLGLFDEFGSPYGGSGGGGGGTVAEDTATQQYAKSFVHREYAKKISVQRKWIDDQDFVTLRDLGSQLGLAAARTREQHGLRVFDFAFQTRSEGEYQAPDGLALCANAHTTPTSSKTWDNLGTGALTAANVTAAVEAMRDYTDDRDLPISTVPDMLVVPDELEEEAFEIIASAGKVDTANNNRNVHNGRYQLVVIQGTFLSDANNWFLIDSMAMRQALIWYDRVPLELADDGNLSTQSRSLYAYMRYSLGFTDWRWVYGSQVA